MACRHCGKATNLSVILCDSCAEKALHILPADPKERVHIYGILLKSDNPVIRMCVEQLMKDDATAIEAEQMDDWMFDTREA
jgi:hypothetical protein